MARITDQKRPNGVTYILDIDEKILKEGTFQYFAQASDAPRVNYCSLFLDLLKYTPRQHEKYSIHSMQIENIEGGGGGRITLKAQPYAFTEEQIHKMLERIHIRIQPDMQGRYPLIDEAGLKDYEEEQRAQRGEFGPDEEILSSDPVKYTAQVMLHATFQNMLPDVRAHVGDIIHKGIAVDHEKHEITYHIGATGACKSCGSASSATINTLMRYLIGYAAHEKFAPHLGDYKVKAIAVYEDTDPNVLSYFMTSDGGVYDRNGALLRQSPRPAPSNQPA